MKLTSAEKLTLLMVADIHKHLEIKNGINAKLVENAVANGHEWALDWEYGVLFGDSKEELPPEVEEVSDLLDMWSFIEEAHAKLSPADKARVEKEAEPFGKNPVFPGFDGNHEDQYGIARFLVEELEVYGRFKGRDLNSHASLLPNYRRMYALFEPMRATLTDGPMNADQLIALLQEKRHEKAVTSPR